HGAKAVAGAAAVEPGLAGLALAAGLEHLHRHALAGTHAPSGLRILADRLQHADHLVAGNEGVGGGQMAGVLVVVGAAEAAGLDAEPALARADGRQREAAALEAPRLGQHQRLGAHFASSSRVKAARTARIASTARGTPA